MKRLIILVLLIVGSLLSAISIFEWDFIEDEKFIVFYPDGYKFQAEEVMRYANNHYQEIKNITGNDSDFKVRFVIQDPGEVANGYADNVNMLISVFTNDPTSLEDFSNDNWLRIVSVHELTHISQLSNSSGLSKVATTLFGNMLSPNMAVPLWIVEGITVFTESSLTPYEGRMNYGYYPAIVSAKAAAGKLPNLVQASYWDATYPGGQYYIYGGSFFRFLSKQYGNEKIGELFRKNGEKFWGLTSLAFPFTALDISAKQVFGKSFPKLFEEWHQYETEKAKDWHYAGNQLDIDQEDCYGISRLQQYNGELYFVRTILEYANYRTEIVKYDGITEIVLKSFPTSFIGNLEFKDNCLYYALMEIKSGFANHDQNGKGAIGVLYKYNLETGKNKKILKAEFKDFEVENGDSILLATQRKDAFGSIVYRFDGKKNKLFETNRVIGELTAVNGSMYCVNKAASGSWDISGLDLNSGTLTPILDSPWQETRLKADGKNFTFTGNFDSQYSSYRYNTETGKLEKMIDSSFAADGVTLGNKTYYLAVTDCGERIYTTEVNVEEYTKILPKAFVLPEQEVEYAKEGNAFFKNLKYLFLPNSRFNPLIISGQDGIGYNTYFIYMNYADTISTDIEWSTKLFNPITLSLTAEEVFSGSADFAVKSSLELYSSLRSGLDDISLTYSSDFHQEVQPGISLGWHNTRDQLITSGYYDVNSKGYAASGRLSHSFGAVQLVVNGNYFNEVDADPFILGGDYETIDKAEGYEVETCFNFRLLKIRNGFWNPNLAFGDLHGSLFVQHSALNEKITGYGTEAGLDIGVGWMINLNLIYGVNYVDGELKQYYSIGLGF